MHKSLHPSLLLIVEGLQTSSLSSSLLRGLPRLNISTREHNHSPDSELLGFLNSSSRLSLACPLDLWPWHLNLSITSMASSLETSQARDCLIPLHRLSSHQLFCPTNDEMKSPRPPPGSLPPRASIVQTIIASLMVLLRYFERNAATTQPHNDVVVASVS